LAFIIRTIKTVVLKYHYIFRLIIKSWSGYFSKYKYCK